MVKKEEEEEDAMPKSGTYANRTEGTGLFLACKHKKGTHHCMLQDMKPMKHNLY